LAQTTNLLSSYLKAPVWGGRSAERIGNEQEGYMKQPTCAVVRHFGEVAGYIVDTQIKWRPGQNGRWQITYLADGTPRIQFTGFRAGASLMLKSLNGNCVRLGLEAAALAISECAMNWTSSHAEGSGAFGSAEEASTFYLSLHRYIAGEESGLTHKEKNLIRWYND
jgi:hypothetical protein